MKKFGSLRRSIRAVKGVKGRSFSKDDTTSGINVADGCGSGRRRHTIDNISEALVFGVPLEQLRLSKDGIPIVLLRLAEYVSMHGMCLVGLFRVNGNIRVMKELRAKFNIHGDTSLEECNDVESVGGLLKMWLRELPESLVAKDVCIRLIDIQGSDTSPRHDISFLHQLRDAVDTLPKVNYVTLAYLSKFLHAVSQKADENKMHAANLAIVFAPNIFPSNVEADAPLDDNVDSLRVTMLSGKNLTALMYTFITHYYEIFESPKAKKPPADIPPFEKHKVDSSDLNNSKIADIEPIVEISEHGAEDDRFYDNHICSTDVQSPCDVEVTLSEPLMERQPELLYENVLRSRQTSPSARSVASSGGSNTSSPPITPRGMTALTTMVRESVHAMLFSPPNASELSEEIVSKKHLENGTDFSSVSSVLDSSIHQTTPLQPLTAQRATPPFRQRRPSRSSFKDFKEVLTNIEDAIDGDDDLAKTLPEPLHSSIGDSSMPKYHMRKRPYSTSHTMAIDLKALHGDLSSSRRSTSGDLISNSTEGSPIRHIGPAELINSMSPSGSAITKVNSSNEGKSIVMSNAGPGKRGSRDTPSTNLSVKVPTVASEVRTCVDRRSKTFPPEELKNELNNTQPRLLERRRSGNANFQNATVHRDSLQDPITPVEDETHIKAMIRESHLLYQRIVSFEKRFEELHGRKPKGNKDKTPVIDEISRFKYLRKFLKDGGHINNVNQTTDSMNGDASCSGVHSQDNNVSDIKPLGSSTPHINDDKLETEQPSSLTSVTTKSAALNGIESRLMKLRQRAQRPTDIHEMTLAELKQEKTDIKVALLAFESAFSMLNGVQPSSTDKEPVHPMYRRHTECKALLLEGKEPEERSRTNGNIAKSWKDVAIGQMNLSGTFVVKEGNKDKKHRNKYSTSGTAASREEGANGSSSFVAEVDDFNVTRDMGSPRTSHGCHRTSANEDSVLPVTSAETKQLKDEYSKLKILKRELQVQLHQFEDNFAKVHGRKVQGAEDREPIRGKYIRYKEYKEQLSELSTKLHVVKT